LGTAQRKTQLRRHQIQSSFREQCPGWVITSQLRRGRGRGWRWICMYIDRWIHFRRSSTHFLELLLQTQQSAFNFNHPLLQHILQEQQNRKTKNSGSSARWLNAMAKFPKRKVKASRKCAWVFFFNFPCMHMWPVNQWVFRCECGCVCKRFQCCPKACFLVFKDS